VFFMHPTEARITITATAGTRLNACQVGRAALLVSFLERRLSSFA
jgi:hypothetical protein